jgi:hypothetical protein
MTGVPTRARPDRDLAVVERHKPQVKAGGDRSAAALAGGLGGALTDDLGVACGHPKAVAGEGFAQRRLGGAQLGRGRVHRAEAFGQGEGALGLGPVCEEAAGLPAQRVAIVPAPPLRPRTRL